MTDDKPNVDPADLPDDAGVTMQIGGGGVGALWWLPLLLFLLYILLP
jgi:hypothetical protein